MTELRDRFAFGRPQSRSSMLSHVPGRDLRTTLWRETMARTPRHYPETTAPHLVTDWHAAYDPRDRHHCLRGRTILSDR